MVNKEAGICYLCKLPVAAKRGRVIKGSYGSVLTHLPKATRFSVTCAEAQNADRQLQLPLGDDKQ